MVSVPVFDPDGKIDFYAGNERAFRQLLPMWDELKERQGTFFVSRHVHNLLNSKAVTIPHGYIFDDFSPLVLSNYKDLHDIYCNIEERPIVIYEPEYGDNPKGLYNLISLFLCKDQRTLNLRRSISDNVLLIDNEKSAASYLLSFIKGVPPKHIEAIGNHSVGLVYMAFGEKAKKAVKKSIATLKRLGYSYPVCIVDEEMWAGESPFDANQRRNFQFRAGRIKPFLYQYTPFEYNLYVDADTKFMKPIHNAFLELDSNDLVVTEEKLSLRDLYNKKLAGWEINLLERDTTIIEIGGDDTQKFINSGVFLFKQNKKTVNLFKDWNKEWLRFQEWDEQLALMRAIHNNDAAVKRLSVEWNSPQARDDTIIFHNYGTGNLRMNI